MKKDNRRLLSLLKNRPLIVGTLLCDHPLVPQVTPKKLSSVDLLEVRLDTLPYKTISVEESFSKIQMFLKTLRIRTSKPLILTLRSLGEGGGKWARHLSEGERTEILSQFLPMAAFVDVEMSSPVYAKKITKLAHKLGVFVIHSIHNFSGPGNMKELNRLAVVSKKWTGDFFKVAVTPRHEGDVDTFLQWGKNLSHPQKILIAMGKMGEVTRILGYSFGSQLTFGHLGVSAAPGQIPVQGLRQSIRSVYGS